MFIPVFKGPLWEQFQRRHNPQEIKATEPSRDHLIMAAIISQGDATDDVDYYLDRLHPAPQGTACWSVEQGGWAARESLWIARFENPVPSDKRDYRQWLTAAGYNMPAE